MHGPTCRTIKVYEQWLRYKSGLSMMMMCWNCEMMEKISIQFVRLDYFSNMCAYTRLTRLQLYKTKYILRIAVTRSNPVPDVILSLLRVLACFIGLGPPLDLELRAGLHNGGRAGPQLGTMEGGEGLQAGALGIPFLHRRLPGQF